MQRHRALPDTPRPALLGQEVKAAALERSWGVELLLLSGSSIDLLVTPET